MYERECREILRGRGEERGKEEWEERESDIDYERKQGDRGKGG
jgi:hypothetical protein